MIARLLRYRLIGVLVVLGASAMPAHAAVIQVTTRADETDRGDGLCSLREAISAVNSPQPGGDCDNAGGGSNTIQLGSGRYALSLGGPDEGSNATGDLNIAGTVTNLTIVGAGAGATTVAADGLGDRVLNIAPGASVTLAGLTITGGNAPPGASVTGNAPGGDGEAGGGILNLGSLELIHSVVANNRAGNGGNVHVTQGGPPEAVGGRGGVGGGVYNAGTLTLADSTVANNHAGDGGSVDRNFGGGGVGGDGGGVYNTGTLLLSGSAISGNAAGSGGTGADSPAVGQPGGAGGNGGGIYNSSRLNLSGSTISANFAGAGGHGGGGSGGRQTGSGNQGGWGGGVYTAFMSSLSASNSTLADNFAGPGGDGGSTFDGTGGNGGAGGSGGGLAVAIGGFASLANVTTFANARGAGGLAGSGNLGAGTAGVLGLSGGVLEQNDSCIGVCTRLQNTIVAENGGGNCSGSIASGGHNLVFGDDTCPGINGDPKLGPLRDNGGATQTAALLSGSAAVDLAPPGAGCPQTDQRGVVRPQGAGCDVGAYELAPPVIAGARATPSGPSSAAVTATVSPNLQDTKLTVRYGSTAAHQMTTASTDAGAGATPAAISIRLAGLASSTTYHAQLVASNADGAASSGDLTFTTPAPGGGGAVNPIAPALSHVRQSASRWLEGSGVAIISARRRLPVGTTFSFRLNETATVSFAFTQAVPGRSVNHRCLAQTRRNAHRRRCTRAAIRGTLSFTAHSGANKVRFDGRLSRRHKLAPGTYTLAISATDAARQRSTTRQLTFAIARRVP